MHTQKLKSMPLRIHTIIIIIFRNILMSVEFDRERSRREVKMFGHLIA